MVPNWKRGVPASATGDRRKLVTLELGGRTFVTVLNWTGTAWVGLKDLPFNVVAWDDLPATTFSNGTTRGIGLPSDIPPASKN